MLLTDVSAVKFHYKSWWGSLFEVCHEIPYEISCASLEVVLFNHIQASLFIADPINTINNLFMARHRTYFMGLFMTPYICLYEGASFEMLATFSNSLACKTLSKELCDVITKLILSEFEDREVNFNLAKSRKHGSLLSIEVSQLGEAAI